MRNLLISLTFIFALIISSATDVFSQSPIQAQRGTGGMVDVFTLISTGGDDYGFSPRVSIQITEAMGGDVILARELDYDTQNDTLPIPQDIYNQLSGQYYVKVYFDDTLVGGGYILF